MLSHLAKSEAAEEGFNGAEVKAQKFPSNLFFFFLLKQKEQETRLKMCGIFVFRYLGPKSVLNTHLIL